MNKLSTFLDSLGGAVADVTSALNPPKVTNTTTAAPTDTKMGWIIGAVAGVVLIIVLVMFAKKS